MAYLERQELFSHIDIRYQLSGHQVDLDFLLSAKTFIAELEFEGNSALSDRRLRRLSRIRLGEELAASRLLSARDLIRDGYRQEGYYSAEVAVQINRRYKDVEAEIVFEIDEGYQSQVSSLAFSEELPDALDSLKQEMIDEAIGLPASAAGIESLRLKYLSRMREQGYLQASLEVREQEYSVLSGDISLLVAAVSREPMMLEFQGNKHLSDAELRDSLAFGTRTIPFTPYAVSTLARKIKELYEEHGYYFAEVKIEQGEDSDGRSVQTLSIVEGPRVVIEEVVFHNNRSIDAAELRSLMRTAPALFWPFSFLRQGYLVRKTLAEDLNALKDYYESLGFFAAEVKSDVYHDAESNSLTVVVRIDEGVQSTLSHVKLRWKDAAKWPSDDPRRGLISKLSEVGQQGKYTQGLVEQERRRLEEQIRDEGYPSVDVDAHFDSKHESLVFLVDTGPFVMFGDTYLAGNVYTDRKVILRELDFGLAQPWEAKAVDKAEERLYKLGLFEQVSVRSSRGKLEGPIEDVLVQVRERDTGVYGFSAGFNSEDGVAAGTEYAQRNLGGLGRSIVLSFKGFLKEGERIVDAGHARLTYSHPHLFDTELELVSDAFLQFAVKLVDQFSYDRFGGSLGLRYEADDNLEVQLLYRLYYEDLFDVEEMAILGEYDRDETFYAMLKPILRYDRRDDVFNPHQGFFSLIEGTFNSKALGSEVDLAGVMARHTQYIPLSKTLVFAQSLRFRVFRTLSGDDVVPLSSRLFLGGRDSLRGFSRNSIGPRSTDGIIVGGDSSFDSMSEIRYSLTDNFVGVLFVDLGSSHLDSPGTFSDNPLSWEDIRVSPGVGIRYRTPIGPLSLDYGIALDRQKGEGFGHFNIGIGAAF
jgi:outer membrane protein insertion porin family